MLFNMERDTGDAIAGYVVADTFLGSVDIVVRAEGRELARLATDEQRMSLVHAGRHGTGLCGFTVDERHVPDLADLPEVSIHEAATDLLVVRRCPPEAALPWRIVRMETHLLPLAGLDRALAPRFRYGYGSIERWGRETALQSLMLPDYGSLYVSGRFLYRTMQGNLEPHAATVAVLRDPRRELAERLLVLNRVAVKGLPLLGERDLLALEPALAYAAELDLRTASAMRAGLRAMPARVKSLLSNPLTRMLVANDADDRVHATALAPALRTLSRFTLVGTRERWGQFRDEFAALIGLDAGDLPEIGELGPVDVLHDELCAVKSLDAILDVDLELYHHVGAALEKAAESTAGDEAAAGGPAGRAVADALREAAE